MRASGRSVSSLLLWLCCIAAHVPALPVAASRVFFKPVYSPSPIQSATPTASPPSTPPPCNNLTQTQNATQNPNPGVAQLPAPGPNMLPLPYLRSWSFPGPTPQGPLPPVFNLSLPNTSFKYYLEPESGTYRTPQNRHVFGPFPKLPSALLLQGTIQFGGKAVQSGTQGALFFHQELYYKGGAEMGWVYFCRDKVLKTYMSANANVQGQLWSAVPAPDTSYVGKALSYRMDLFPEERRSTARVYAAAGSHFTQAYPWPSWFQYNQNRPWYITLTWQRHEDGPINGTLRNASLWYLP